MFFTGGVIPGIMRVPEMLDLEEELGYDRWNQYSWSFAFVFAILATIAFHRKTYL